MSYRTWSRVLLAAVAVSAVAGAGQLGLAYGLGIVRIARTFDPAERSQWSGQLVWVGWAAMVAVVTGAVVADRLALRYGRRATVAGNAALAVAATLGATVVAPLSMQPARVARVASVDPVLTTGIVAALGVIVGLLAAMAALSLRPLAGWNIAGLTSVAWLLALVSVLPSLGPHDPLPAVRLGVPDLSTAGHGAGGPLAVLTMPILALIASVVIGLFARRRGLPVAQVAMSAVVGPAMLALAYVLAGPGGSADAYQRAPYWGSVIALGVAAAGSVLSVMARWPLLVRVDKSAQDIDEQGQDRQSGSTGQESHEAGQKTHTDATGKPGHADAGGEPDHTDTTGRPANPDPSGQHWYPEDGAGSGATGTPTDQDSTTPGPAKAGPARLSERPNPAMPSESPNPARLSENFGPTTSSSDEPLDHRPRTEDFWPTQPLPTVPARPSASAEAGSPTNPAASTDHPDGGWAAFDAAQREIGLHSGPLPPIPSRPVGEPDRAASPTRLGPRHGAPVDFSPPLARPTPAAPPLNTPPMSAPPAASPLNTPPLSTPPAGSAPAAPPTRPTSTTPPMRPAPTAWATEPTAPASPAGPRSAPAWAPGPESAEPTGWNPGGGPSGPYAFPEPTAPRGDAEPVAPRGGAAPAVPEQAPWPSAHGADAEFRTAGSAPEAAMTASPDWVGEPGQPGEDSADEGMDRADAGKARGRRKLFRRNRAGEETPAGAPAPREKARNRTDDEVPPHDEEYVDWVSGLSGRDTSEDDPSLRRYLRAPNDPE